MNKVISFSNYFKFKTRIYYVPSSGNVVGEDVYPKFWSRPFELLEVLECSSKTQSLDDGFVKDKESGFYVKNRDDIGTKISEDDIIGQFEWTATTPPYWFYDEDSYVKFVQINMETTFSNKTKIKYMNEGISEVKVEEDENPEIPVFHFYRETIGWDVKTFHRNKITNWPKEKGVTIQKINIEDYSTSQ